MYASRPFWIVFSLAGWWDIADHWARRTGRCRTGGLVLWICSRRVRCWRSPACSPQLWDRGSRWNLLAPVLHCSFILLLRYPYLLLVRHVIKGSEISTTVVVDYLLSFLRLPDTMSAPARSLQYREPAVGWLRVAVCHLFDREWNACRWQDLSQKICIHAGAIMEVLASQLPPSRLRGMLYN